MQPFPVYNPVPARFLKISGSVLKIVAVVTMLIDHIGAGIVYPMLYSGLDIGPLSREQSILFYYVLRRIGRTAFPVFCFLLVEGFLHTKSRPRYALLLFVFALLSEAPFDLALIPGNELSHTLQVGRALAGNAPVYLRDQNVYFTLLFGLLAIWFTDAAFSHAASLSGKRPALRTPAYLAAALTSFLAVAFFCFLSDVVCTDYDHRGVTLIAALYLLRTVRPLQLAAGYVYITLFGTNEIWSLPGFLLILFYNGERGFIKGNRKYAFYAFYPVHLALLYVVRTFLL